MKKLKRIATVVIILTQVLNTSYAVCTWGTFGSTDCAISCRTQYVSGEGNETPEKMMIQLEEKWNEREICHTDGLSLTLETQISYPNNNVKANWFTAPVKVKELNFNMNSVSTMEPNAFNSTALKWVRNLLIPNMNSARLKNGIFNGLESLEELVIVGSYLSPIEKGVLDSLNRTLKHFSLTESSTSRSEILIDGLTGSEELIALEYVKIKYNLKSTLTHESFVGLRNVTILDLSGCQIETIGAGTFDPISNSIRELNLENNKIKTLPDGLFNYMLPNDITKVLLDDNKWDCVCELMPFKTCLVEHSNFIGSFKCDTPSDHNGFDVIDRDFCESYVPPETTYSTSTSTTTDIPTSSTTSTATNHPTEPPIPDEFNQICYDAGETDSSKIVSIKVPRASLKINENEYGDTEVTVGENSVLIWFSLVEPERGVYYRGSGELSCAFGTTTNPVPIYNLKEDTVYTFCVMDSTETSVSPLDCISYTKGNTREQPWLLNGSKSLVIAMVVLTFCISVFVGLVVGFFTFNKIVKKRNQHHNHKHNACINEVLKESLHSNGMMKQPNRMSNMTTNSSINTKRTTGLTIDYYLDKAPPLPARQYPLEEPIYAIVRDTGTLN